MKKLMFIICLTLIAGIIFAQSNIANQLVVKKEINGVLMNIQKQQLKVESMPKEVRKLLSQLPASWDDLKFLSGYPGESVVLARRKDNIWYIGGINGTDDKQTLSFTLDALPNLGKKIMLFKDGSDEKQVDIIKHFQFSKDQKTLNIDCLPRGGFVVVIE